MDKPKRYIIAIGSPESPGCAYLKKVPTDVERIVKFFESASQGYEHVLSEEIPIGAPSAVVKKALEEWFASDTLKRSDTVVIYFAGHGEPDVGKFNSACLLLSDSKIKLPSTYITSRDLISIIYGGENERPGSILLILDVCYAGAFAGQGIGEAVNAISEIEADSGFCTMGSTAKSVAEDGVFLEAFFGTYSDDAWRPAGRNFPILDLVEGMNRWFEINRKGQRASCNITGARGRNKFIFTELKRQVGIQDFAHWDIKARGIDYAGLKDWFFSGRIIALKEICNWLKTETPTKIVFVTGDPGSGKSALLGRTLLSAIPSTRDSIMEGLKIKIDDDTLPEADSIKAYVNLKGSEVRDVIKILASQFDVQADSAEELVNSLAGLTNKISGIIFDSLDEANDSFIHFAELFELLASISNVKLIIGSRRNILLNHFGTRARTIDLDDTKYFDYRDIQNFIYNRFKTAPAFAKMNAETEVNLKRLTERITIKANHSFLYGRVVSRYLIDKLSPEAIEHGEPFEDLRVPEDINEAFGEDLRRFKNGQQNLVEDLLVPLAYARGKGMPQKNIWCSVASKIANRTYSNTDIRKLKEEASYYLIEDVDNGEVVYRLFHEAFAEYFRNRTKHEGVQEQIALALLLLRGQNGSTELSWKHTTSPYILNHYAAHSAIGNRLDQDLADFDFLLHYPSENLLPVMSFVQSANAKRIANAYMRASRWQKSDSKQFIAQLSLRAFEYGSTELQDTLIQQNHSLPWKPTWCHWSNPFSNYVVGETSEVIITGITCLDPLFGPLAICLYGGSDPIRIWRLNDGKLLKAFAPPTLVVDQFGTSETPNLVTTLKTDNGLILVVAWRETVAVYSVDKNVPLYSLRCDGRVTAMTTAIVNGQPFLYTSITSAGKKAISVKKKVDAICLVKRRLPDLTLEKTHDEISNAAIYSLATTEINGQAIIVSGSDSYNSGMHLEKSMLRCVSADTLEILFSPDISYDSGYIKDVTPIWVTNTLWVLATNSDRLIMVNPTTGEEINLSSHTDLISKFVGYRLSKSILEIISFRFNTLIIYKIDFVIARPNVSRTITSFEIREPKWLDPIYVHNRYRLISADKFLRIWDADQFFSVDNSNIADSNSSQSEEYFVTVSVKDKVYVGASNTIFVWDTRGNLLFKRAPIGSVLTHLSFFTEDNGDYKIVGMDTGSKIWVFQPDLEPVACFDTLKVDTIMSSFNGMTVFRQDGVDLAALSGKNEDQRYEIRLLNLHTGAFVKINRTIGISGYDNKPMYAPGFLNYSGNEWLVLIGGNGQVRLCDLKQTEFDIELDLEKRWAMDYYHYIRMIDCTVVGNQPLVVTGNDGGDLAVRDVINNVYTAEISNAHRGSMTCLKFHAIDPLNSIIVSASTDGTIKFWSLRLQLLHTIDTESLLRSFSFSSTKTMIVVCPTGIINIELDWNLILGSNK